MVKGLNKFREFFKEFSDNYVIIGGTACDLVIDGAGFTPRATRDIDIILVVEALTGEFVTRFWDFIIEGKYGKAEKNEDDRKYYRFKNPANEDFPFQIELFSRVPDLLAMEGSPHLTPIPVDEDLSSLSAILMNDDYYHFTLAHCSQDVELQRANPEALICLKAKAYLEMTERKARGEKVEEKHIKKHKSDIFRIGATLTEDEIFDLPDSIKL